MSYATALITGASGGLGRAFAKVLPDDTSLVLVGRDGVALEALAADLARPGRRIDVLIADLSTAEGRERVIEAGDRFEIDLLINNAGRGDLGGVLDNAAAYESATVAVNVVALAEITRRLLPGMIARAAHGALGPGAAGRTGRAGLINVASAAGFAPIPYFTTYSATKAFVLSYTEGLAVELRESPIDIVALTPGPTRTGFGGRAGFRLDALPLAWPPERAARAAIDGLEGDETVVVTGPASRAALIAIVRARALLARLTGDIMGVVLPWARKGSGSS